MAKRKVRHVHHLSDDGGDLLDVNLDIEKGKVRRFALNYRASINGKWHIVYRVDNYHGFLHEQRFWISKELIPLEEEERTYNTYYIVEMYSERIALNYTSYKKYYLAKLNGR
ncbi:MAG TPA: hypothetical protein VJI46_03910 [Candidatus Nanoarchaeia archaeon]|nr:hypothetical protein [Candidatus Nanoarchaeia archaeon]